jgi:hypothetical protein
MRPCGLLDAGFAFDDADHQRQDASMPGGARPVLIRCRKILRHYWGLVMKASTFFGEPQRLQRKASTS